ncbi:ROK family transcriptional regulator [Leucobacter sp. CSA1]|uniref:ROK family transcriptional regulator n=1 Tax=Leucobacter chromiisoli TaxID=2796471 RepID=A0A934Q9Y7_9MICO|nr:ROK family transcriptional regulator [Leucobacter chromiisoli]MBK0419487.1 ROK family transcriptional regulator [Leucobacter chromiisoli]
MKDATTRSEPAPATPPQATQSRTEANRLRQPVAPSRSLRLNGKATLGAARQHNRTLLLQTLYLSGPLSRADLARATKLTKVTVSELIAELISEGLVRELGQRESQRPGKPAILVDLARDAHAVVSLDLSDHRLLRGAVLSLAGEVLARAEAPLDGATGDAATERTCELAQRLIEASTVPLLGLGVGTPGVVDEGGTVRTAPNLGWNEEPLRRILEDRTGLAVVVSNDANAAALAEHSYGDACDDLMLVAIGHGVGSGLIVGGRPVTGSRFAAGEIGQVMVGTDLGIEAPYSRDQVLEHWLSVPSLTAALAGAGDEGRDRVLREAGQRLGVALAPVVGALNLAEVVLAGPEELIDDTLVEATLEILRRRTMPDSHSALVLRTSTQGKDLVLRGATALVLQERLGVS